MLELWNYFRGYVIIEVSGFSVERFVNLAVHRGIYIWDVKFGTKGVTMKVSIEGFKMLRPFARKTKCKIKILQKKGVPFVAFKYRKRKFLAGGLIFLIVALYTLSSFVWKIEINGNDRLSKDEILSAAKKFGLDNGRIKYLIDTKKIKTKLRNEFSEISWVDIHIKGTRATINMTEIIEKIEVMDKSEPCNVVAAKDGVITNMVTISGTPVKKQKDIVRKGDVLVKSEVLVKEDENGKLNDYVHAEAEVRAKVYNELSFKIPYNYSVKVYTGEVKKLFSLKIFNHRFSIPFVKNKFDNFEKITSREQLKLTEDYPLPVFIFTEYIKEFEEKKMTRNIEQAKEYADEVLTGRIVREFDIEADVFDKSFEYVQEPDGLLVNAIVTTIERIDEKSAVSGSEENTSF